MIKLLSILLVSGVVLSSMAVELVKNGSPVAEIVISETASPSIKTAADELQRHLEKISGAKLPIVSKVSPNIQNQVYVGESKYTQELGIKLNDIKHDGFKIIAEKNYVVLAGNEIELNSKYVGNIKETKSVARQRAWEKFTGHRWRRPTFYDFRNYRFCNVGLLDGTGTLYAVYELLEQLGFRWYMPVEEIGIVYPELKNVNIKTQSIKREPEFPQRRISPAITSKDEFLWFKSMRCGTSYCLPIYHSVARLMEFDTKDQPRAYFGKVNGKLNYHVPNLGSERLQNDFIEFLEFAEKVTPEINYACIGQPDGWTVLDDATVAEGWDKTATRGSTGAFSDYYWDFILKMRKRFMEKHPDKKYSVFAYGRTFRAPTNIDKVPDDVTVVLCQHSSKWMLHRTEFDDREEWLSKMPNPKQQLLIWEYYHQHTTRYDLPTVPMISTKNMKKNFDGLYGKAAGFLTETGWTTSSERRRGLATLGTPRVGLTHLQIYLHSRLSWDRGLDLQALVNEYCELFFGPAHAEMKEFYKFAEDVWNRPESRRISASSGFVRLDDVKTFFDILDRASKKAGKTIYGKRIAYIAKEMAPLKNLEDKLKRVGPQLNAFIAKHPIKIDGDLDKPFWRSRDWTFTPLREMYTGNTPKHVKTNVSFRWLKDDSALLIGIECIEPKMANIRTACKNNDSTNIFSDDFVEIKLETQGRICPKIVINGSGAIYDSCLINDTDIAAAYSVKDFAVKKYPDRWTIEMMIDAKKLLGERPKSTSPWGINICRQRLAGNTPEFYMLSPSGTNFKDLKYMGNLQTKK